MSDKKLREYEQRWRATGAAEDEANVLREQVRKGQVSIRAVARAALLGSTAARLANPDFTKANPEDHSPEEDQVAWSLLFRDQELSEEEKAFIMSLTQQTQEIRETLSQFELVQEGDKEPPDAIAVTGALYEHFKTEPEQLKLVTQMENPTLLMIPVYEPEEAGFSDIIQAIDTHRFREGQEETEVEIPEWLTDAQPSARIVGWKVAIVSGVRYPSDNSNPYYYGPDGRPQGVQDQLQNWLDYCRQKGMQLCQKVFYALLQMHEIRQNPASSYRVMDYHHATVLYDEHRPEGASVRCGTWEKNRLAFWGCHPTQSSWQYHFRPMVVTKQLD